MKNKVLLIAPQNSKGGIGAVINLYAAHLSSVDVLYTYPETKGVNKYFFFVHSLLNLVQRLLSDKKISIVHIHTASNGSFYRKSVVLIIAKLFGKKTILHIHGGGFKPFMDKLLMRRWFIKFIMKQAQMNICLSNEWLNYFTKQQKLDNVMVLANPIVIYPYRFKALNPNRIDLLYLGAITSSKGIYDLLEYLSTNDNFLSGKIHLRIGGIGELEFLNDFVKKLGIKEQVTIIGWVEGELKIKLFADADIFILPSRAEGLPVSIIEAMSFGKPIIATSVGGIPSLVGNNQNGWLYEYDHINHLDSVFKDIFNNPGILSSFSQKSYERSLNFDVNKIIQELTHLYAELDAK